MPDIIDIAPVIREVDTRRFGKVSVTGLTLSGLVQLVKQNPELFQFFQNENKSFENVEELMDLGEEVVGAFLAAGLGHPGNSDVAEKCRSLNPEDTWELFTAIMEESFPGGAVNFFKRVAEAVKKADLGELSKAVQIAQPEVEEQRKAS